MRKGDWRKGEWGKGREISRRGIVAAE